MRKITPAQFADGSIKTNVYIPRRDGFTRLVSIEMIERAYHVTTEDGETIRLDRMAELVCDDVMCAKVTVLYEGVEIMPDMSRDGWKDNIAEQVEEYNRIYYSIQKMRWNWKPVSLRMATVNGEKIFKRETTPEQRADGAPDFVMRSVGYLTIPQMTITVEPHEGDVGVSHHHHMMQYPRSYIEQVTEFELLYFHKYDTTPHLKRYNDFRRWGRTERNEFADWQIRMANAPVRWNGDEYYL